MFDLVAEKRQSIVLEKSGQGPLSHKLKSGLVCVLRTSSIHNSWLSDHRLCAPLSSLWQYSRRRSCSSVHCVGDAILSLSDDAVVVWLIWREREVGRAGEATMLDAYPGKRQRCTGRVYCLVFQQCFWRVLACLLLGLLAVMQVEEYS